MSKAPWNGALFAVGGRLAKRYAEALKVACGRECPLSEFQIDRLGWSPQIAAILGPDYLNCDALRYGIILSPDQGDAPLAMRRFSYEITLANKIYHEARPTLLHLIEYEPVIVEIDNGQTICRTATDALAIKLVEATLSSPQDTLQKTTQLLALADGLRNESRLLDDGYIAQMLDLVKEVGDPTRRPLPPPLTFHPGSLWADLDTPIYVLRDGAGAQPILITIRPETISPGMPITVLDLAPELVDQLHAAGYLRYLPSETVFHKRLGELERDAMLTAGMQPSDDRRARRRELARNREAQALLPQFYWDLDDELKQLQAGAPFDPERLSLESRWALSAPARANEVIVHLLARFVRYDYRLLTYHHPRIVQGEWERYSEAKRQYLAAHFPTLPQIFV